MDVELPDPDLSVSFVVDDGEAVGPLTLREIARSIVDGERPDGAYVWWTGAGDWMRFNSDDRLTSLSIDPPAVEEPELKPELIDLIEPELKPEPELADPLEQISLSPSSVLADVGARLEALALATRHVHTTSKLDAAGDAPALRLVEGSDQVDLRDAVVPLSTVRAATLETDFDSMVRRTENHSRLLEQAERVRELLARACGAAMSRKGYAVERRNQSGGSYFLGFESGIDSAQMSLEISPAASVDEASGQHVHISLSWGRAVADLDDALAVVRAQLPVADRPLGVISSDAHVDTGLTATRVEVTWSIDDYIDGEFSVDRDRLEQGLDAMQQALEQRWYDLFTPAG